jgi:murein DD-endopeptidase MepM/ murein hydrolase activator NlpD
MRLGKVFFLIFFLGAGVFGIVAFIKSGIIFALPHERIIIQLPFTEENLPDYMTPYGETIEHPDHGGHPGLDFNWQDGGKIISSSEGKVSSITYNSEKGSWDVKVVSGGYFLLYAHLNAVTPELREGMKINKGDDIGEVSTKNFAHLHWEFGSRYNKIDRLCPLTYFDTKSLQIIESLWENIPDHNEFKTQFPYICNGDYYGKEE